MNHSDKHRLRQLDDCGCCEGITTLTPTEIFNQPGQKAISYRTGTHALFKQSMQARLSCHDLHALQSLGTRDENDFIIALLDAWAVTSDVLTFYQERIANESYLRTAVEDASLYHLAYLIGYKPRPGVAASTRLAFMLDEAEGAIKETTIDAGTKVQSIPQPGERPEIYETVEAITGRPEWNALKPRLSQPQELKKTMEFALIKGVATPLTGGDRILIVDKVDGSSWEMKTTVEVAANAAKNTTRATFVENPIEPAVFHMQMLLPGAFFTQPVKLSNTIISNQVLNQQWRQSRLVALTKVQGWSLSDVKKNIQKQIVSRPKAGKKGVFHFTQVASIFGHNAPSWGSLPPGQRIGERVRDKDGAVTSIQPVYPSNWDSPSRNLQQESDKAKHIYLDSIYKGIVTDSWVVLESPSRRHLYQIKSVTEVSRSDFSISAKVTRLTLNSSANLDKFTIRMTRVYITEHTPLELAELPVNDDAPTAENRNKLLLDEPDLYLREGQTVILSGERKDLDGVIESEVLTISKIILYGGYTALTFKKNIRNTYKRHTLSLNANVALATHGESKTEVLGSGNGNAPFQNFQLRQPPLTYISANNAKGASPVLAVSVDGIKWREVDSLFGAGPDQRIYVIHNDAEGNTSIQFGNGQQGSRLPSGAENITATYRKGMGETGLLDKGQLSLLMNKPMGVRTVSNLLATSGAEDREGLKQVRRNASLPIMTLDRIVSLQDYEDFACAFAGIAKALVSWSWDGNQRGVFVTVAGINGNAVDADSPTYMNLLAAMQQAGDPLTPIRVQSYRPAFFRVEVKVLLDSSYPAEKVVAAIKATLRKHYAFDRRDFSQAVIRAEVISTIQHTAGVVAVDLDRLYRVDANNPSLESRLIAETPRAGAGKPLAAELLTLDPQPLSIGIMS